MSPYPKLTIYSCDLEKYFSGRIFTALEVPRRKPAPDLFLHAAEVMGFEPQACLVIEDSVNGVLAAKAAGMIAWGFCIHHNESALRDAGADEVFRSMLEVQKALGLE